VKPSDEGHEPEKTPAKEKEKRKKERATDEGRAERVRVRPRDESDDKEKTPAKEKEKKKKDGQTGCCGGRRETGRETGKETNNEQLVSAAERAAKAAEEAAQAAKEAAKAAKEAATAVSIQHNPHFKVSRLNGLNPDFDQFYSHANVKRREN